MSHGSQQLRLFRRAIRDGHSLEEACELSAIPIAEARLHIAADARNPPPPEAFDLIGQTPAKESKMARPAKQEHEENGDISGEYQRPDAAIACEIYDKQIAPKLTHIATIKGDLSEPWDQLKEQSRIPRPVFNFVQKLVDEDDDQKRDHMLLSLSELLKARTLFLPRDLVTMADGEEGGPAVPIGERKRPHLTAIDGGDFEADPDELAAQKSRPSVEKAQAELETEQEG